MRQRRREITRRQIRGGKCGPVAEKKKDWNLGFANSSLMSGSEAELFWGRADNTKIC